MVHVYVNCSNYMAWYCNKSVAGFQSCRRNDLSEDDMMMMIDIRYTVMNQAIRKTVLPGMVIPMLKIRRPNGRLIFNMEIAIRR